MDFLDAELEDDIKVVVSFPLAYIGYNQCTGCIFLSLFISYLLDQLIHRIDYIAKRQVDHM